MTTSKHKWQTAVFLFMLGVFFLTGGIRFVIRGHLWWLHGGSDGVDLRPDSDPYRFWGFVILAFAMATFGFWRGVVELLAYLRERKTQSDLR
jgi:hypothetical protein